ncbi:MAG TPA: UvrB/UvrC motif-containing protein [Gemmatimonadaceae bacterium]|nr:UvrB/UvrC motif-containing protein [Gemmatimonadaceae bacterium]
MLCDHCHERDAVVSVTNVESNAVVQLHLCEQCAMAKGVEFTPSMPAHPLAGVLQAAHDQASLMSDAPRCSFCGTTPQEFRDTGRLGCAQCYGAFAESLRELLRRVHGHARHVGRRHVPRNPEAASRAGSLAVLREKLRRAVEREEFELAAALRDEIQGLE